MILKPIPRRWDEKRAKESWQEKKVIRFIYYFMPMEKLSKLLNEYLEIKEKDIQQFMNIAALMTQSDSKLYQTYIISKDFGFISRLVENEKIDFDKIIEKSEYLIEYRWNKIDQNMFENTLLMLLSISDTPIEDLISYLR